jgi:DNA polymerase-3 subunit chi
MTRVEFFLNVPDKLAKTAELCERAVAKGRKLTVFTQDALMSDALRKQLWERSATSFLPSATPEDMKSEHVPIIVDMHGKHLLQDDILINLQLEHPPFFSRFRYLVEMVGMEEEDKAAARLRYKFYRDRGYEVKTTDATD